MQYASARQRKDDGRWDWTVMRDNVIRPAGYCAGPPSEDPGLIPPEHWRQHLEKVAPFRAKYHADGDATKEEAERCYYDYELDQDLREETCGPDQQHRCEARWEDAEQMQQERIVAGGPRRCEQWTHAALGSGSYSTSLTWLCDIHRTREVFEALHPFTPDRWVTYS